MRILAPLFILAASHASANTCGIYEAIEPGDTLSGIAARCDTNVDALFAANPDVDASDLQIGGVIRLIPEQQNEGARAIYDTLAGGWSQDGICIGKEVIAFFGSDTLEFGETRCDVGDVKTSGGSIYVSATSCNAEGEPSDDRIVQITRLPGDAIEYRGVSSWRFERCTDL